MGWGWIEAGNAEFHWNGDETCGSAGKPNSMGILEMWIFKGCHLNMVVLFLILILLLSLLSCCFSGSFGLIDRWVAHCKCQEQRGALVATELEGRGLRCSLLQVTFLGELAGDDDDDDDDDDDEFGLELRFWIIPLDFSGDYWDSLIELVHPEKILHIKLTRHSLPSMLKSWYTPRYYINCWQVRPTWTDIRLLCSVHSIATAHLAHCLAQPFLLRWGILEMGQV